MKQTSTAIAKQQFRASKTWKSIREKVRARQGGLCFITRRKLCKGANCHHLDMRSEFYEDPNIDKYVFLQKSIHEAVHVIYRYYRKDRDVLKRLKYVLDRMLEYEG